MSPKEKNERITFTLLLFTPPTLPSKTSSSRILTTPE